MKKTNQLIFVQTFIAPVHSDWLKIKYHVYLMFMSYLSIRKIYPDVPFCLVTNEESYDYVKAFPYTEILTSLDNYGKPLKPSFSKLHSIDIFHGQTFVHFDNDVFVFSPLPDFTDTIAQSLESNFMEFFWHCRLKHHPWLFPDFARNIKCNYNPGTFGFTADSIIRREYYETAVLYHDKNQAMLAAMPEGAEKRILTDNLQDIFAMIEEGFLYHFVKERGADLALVVPDKYPTEHEWGVKADGFRGLNSDKLDYAHYHAPQCKNYVHLMGWSTNRLDYTQTVLDRVYSDNREAIHEHFGIAA